MPEVGEMAPDFELPSNLEKGKKVRLSDFRGKKNVVMASASEPYSSWIRKANSPTRISTTFPINPTTKICLKCCENCKRVKGFG